MPRLIEYRDGITVTLDLTPSHTSHWRIKNHVAALAVANADKELADICTGLSAQIVDGSTRILATIMVPKGATLDSLEALRIRVGEQILAAAPPEPGWLRQRHENLSAS